MADLQRYNNYIDGQWVAGNQYQANINPSDLSDVIGEYAQADAAQVDAAIAAARKAFPAWSAGGIQARADALEKVGLEILARREELGTLLAREEGKTLPEAIGEVARAGNIFKFFAGECLRQAGEVLQSVRPGVSVEVTREPLGVIGLITPWNFPIAIPAWKIAPALAYGNTVVFKPAELVPGSAWELVRIAHECGLPDGVLNLVMGRGSVVGRRIVEAEEVDAITFTGSTATGRGLAAAGAGTLKRMQLEMGGKNPLLVLDDADLDTAVAAAIDGAYGSTGQRCTASSRLIVQAGIHDRFVERMRSALDDLVVGDPRDEASRMGPVASAAQHSQVLEAIERGVRDGAELVSGGRALDREGYFIEPTLFVGGASGMWLNQEEVFGPVACVVEVSDLDEGIRVCNDTRYGLSAAVITTSATAAQRFEAEAEAGIIGVNRSSAATDLHLPFGGRKQSSFGPREQGKSAREFFTSTSTVYVAGALR